MAGARRVENRDRPEPAGEPGVEDVFILPQVLGHDAGIDLPGGLEGFFEGLLHDDAPVLQVICRDPLPPPQLAGDAPVAGILHPMAVSVAVFVRDELDPAGFHLVKGLGCKFTHLEEPLCGQFRLDHGISPLRIPHGRGVVLYLFEVSGLLKHADYLLPGFETVFSDKDGSLFVEPSMVVDYVDDRQVVPQSDLIVVGIVGRGDLEAAGTELQIHIVVLDDGDFPSYEGDQDFLAPEPKVPLVLGIDAYRSIRHDRLGAGGGDHQVLVGRIPVAVGDEVPQMVQVALGVTVDHLVVGDGGEGDGIPVDHPHSPVDHALLVEMAEGCDDRFREVGIHGEPRAVPVAGCTEFAELVEDYASVLLLPLPGMFEEFLTRQVFLGDAHGLEPRDDLAFGGDGGMVGTGHPAGVLAVHPGLAHQDVVEGVVQDMAHVEDSRHVRRRNHYGVRFPFIWFGMETLVVQPPSIPFVFYFRCIVLCGEFLSFTHLVLKLRSKITNIVKTFSFFLIFA